MNTAIENQNIHHISIVFVPVDIFIIIFGYLNTRGKLAIMQSCKFFYAIPRLRMVIGIAKKIYLRTNERINRKRSRKIRRIM